MEEDADDTAAGEDDVQDNGDYHDGDVDDEA